MYPPDWPRCACGDYALDGKSHCGRPECMGRELRHDDWQRPARRDDGDDDDGDE